MKKQWFATGLLLVGFLSVLPGQNGRGQGGRRGQENSGNWDALLQLPVEPLSDTERQGLLQMREEEKLARDVYQHLATLWNQRTFSQIAKSEQQHMDGVKALLDKYGISDPIEGLADGVFQSEDMQRLYDSLTIEGSASLGQALVIGAKIEDLDIADLLKQIPLSDNQDVLTLWQNLAKGSRNHLRAFVSRLELFELVYTPVYISRELFEAIIGSDMERGFYDAAGNPVMNGSGRKR